MNWIDENRLVLNLDKTNVMVIGSKCKLREIEDFNVTVKGTTLKRVHVTKCLGLLIDDELHWDQHVEKVISTVQAKLGMLRRLKPIVPVGCMKMMYNAFILPHFDYCSQIWSERFSMQTLKLTKLQKRAARIILNRDFATPSATMFNELNWLSLPQRFAYNRAVLMYKCMHNLAPQYLSDCFTEICQFHAYSTRLASTHALAIPFYRTECLKHSPLVRGITIWNSLDQTIKSAPSLSHFKGLLTRHLMNT